mmetsp:Transcript_5733/g.12178  ORF Transcript_5733/g.12178 Transcript_5733/m.12178 type:complete len:827 (+) Transcript_5733:138-2618(+)
MMPTEIPMNSNLKPSDVSLAQQQQADHVGKRKERDQGKTICEDMEVGKSNSQCGMKHSKPNDALEYKDDLIPISTLFAKPHKAQVKISGSGKYLAWLSRGRSVDDPLDDNGVMNIFCKDLETSQIKQLTFAKERDACSHFIFNADETEILFLQEIRRGSESYHLFALEIVPFFDETEVEEKKEPNPRNLIKDPRMTCGIGFVGGVQLWTSVKSPREVYVSTAEIGPFSLFWHVSRINIDTKQCVLVQQNVMSSSASRWQFILKTGIALLCSWFDPPTVPLQWFPDDEMQFRGCIQIDLVNLGICFCARGRKEQQFKTLHSCTFENSNMDLIGSSGGAGTARMDFSRSSSEADTVDIHLCALTGKLASDTTTYDRFCVTTGEHISRLAGNNEKSDITGFVINRKTNQPQFVRYDSGKQTTEVFSGQGRGESNHTQPDEDVFLVDDLEHIGNYFAQSMAYSIISCTSKNDVWVIYAEADRGQQKCEGSPGGYFLFNRYSKGATSTAQTTQDSSPQIERKIELMFPSRPELKGHLLGEMKPLRVTVSDGEEILCYLSEPADEEHVNPPLIMMIHGGPQARDTWGFNPLVQLLCNRGFRVMQVNYRGSTGFGARFIQIGMDGAFCKLLQQDITDVATYVINEGLCAKNRLAIIGGSFGGYSALHGLTFQPDLYKCCVAICPLTAVGAADEQSKKSFSGSPLIKKYWQRVFGENVSYNKKFAMDASPLYNTDNIRNMASVAIYHGVDDPRAPIGHSRKFVEKLKERNIKGEFVSFSGEGHGISKEENRLFMYHRIEKFLCGQFELSIRCGDDDRWVNNTASVEWTNCAGGN